ncbi:MAG: hypothetical protein LUO91_07980 [Methanomicrobiales archaeon]|nr:hypothetical protein [Methanomicrobiales archaeon]
MKPIPDALKAAPGAYRLLMENRKVRVLDLHLKAGEKAPMHDHPHDHVVYVIKDARFRLTFPDGKSDAFDLKAGQSVWLEAGPHATENIGTSEGHNIVIEVKM